jgi:protein TonB
MSRIRSLVPFPRALRRRLAVAVLGLAAAAAAQAQFAQVPDPAPTAAPTTSSAATTPDYKRDAARHIYAAYGSRVWRGKLKPLLFGIAVVETHLDTDGRVIDVVMVRPPAAKEVGPWVVQMIKRAGPFPRPAQIGMTKFTEIWLVDKSGKFQLDSLTEGQL